MRRLLPSLLVLLLVAGVAGMLIRVRRDTQAAHPEIPLGDGSVLVVEGLTWGTNQMLQLESPHWTRLKRALPAKWRQFTGEPQPPRVLNGDPSPRLWLSRRSVTSSAYLSIPHFDLGSVSTEGRERSSGTRDGFGSGERAGMSAQFKALEWRAEVLRFRVRAGSVTQEIALPNPRRHERFPIWQPGPFPQTNFVNGFEFALTALEVALGDARVWRPRWIIGKESVNVADWFDLDHRFLDPTGNHAWSSLPSSEPVCLVVLTAWPSARYPFEEAQLFRLGRLEIPKPGEFVIVPVNGESTNACLHWAVLTGSGSFAFSNGTNRIARPPDGSSLGDSSSLGDRLWEFTYDSPKPQLHLLLRGPEAGGRLLPGASSDNLRLVLRARTSAGAEVKTTGHGYSSSGDGTTLTQWRGYEFDPLPAGEVVELDLTLVKPLRAEFMVATPPAK
jgi:hypothetical protein